MAQSYCQITGFSKRAILNKQHSNRVNRVHRVNRVNRLKNTYAIFAVCIFFKNMYLVGFTSKGQTSGPPVNRAFRCSISRITRFWAQIWNRSDPFYILTHSSGVWSFCKSKLLDLCLRSVNSFFA